tara:strand:- start:13293 stop:13952 length:660 start_codon:yes stop_codon:yes gene_type:complete
MNVKAFIGIMCMLTIATGCTSNTRGERQANPFDIRGGEPVPRINQSSVTELPTPEPPATEPGGTYSAYQPAPPPSYYEPYNNVPTYSGQASILACSITGGDFLFGGRKNRKYQPVSFAVAPGETVALQMLQDDNGRRETIYAQGDLSGVGVRITRNQPNAAGSGFATFGDQGGFVASEPQLARGVSQQLNINDMFRGATMNCGFRSPPGVIPGQRYRRY